MEAHRHMASFTACAVGARDDLAVGNDTTANASAHGEHGQALAAFASAVPQLAQSSQVSVIFHLYHQTSAAGQLGGHVDIPPAQVDTALDLFLVEHRSGDAHACTHKGTVVKLRLYLLDFLSNPVKHGGRVTGRGKFALVQQRAFFVHKPQLHGCSANVHAKTHLLHCAQLLFFLSSRYAYSKIMATPQGSRCSNRFSILI